MARIGNLDAAARYRDVAVLTAGPTALAFVGDFLAVGTVPAVHAAIDRAAGDGAVLADAAPYRSATAGRPAERSLDAYATAPGVRTRAGAAHGRARPARPPARPAGADRRRRDADRRARRPARDGARGRRRRAAAPASRPSCSSACPRRPRPTPAHAARRSSRSSRPRSAAATPSPPLRAALPGLSGVDLDRDLLAPLEGEVALSVTTAAALSGEDPAAVRTGGAPVVTLKARTRNPRATEAALARLRDPLAARLGAAGHDPGLPRAADRRAERLHAAHHAAARADLRRRRAARLIISTAPAGLLPPRGTLAAAPAFRTAIGPCRIRSSRYSSPTCASSSRSASRPGWSRRGFASLRDDLRRARALGAVVTPDPAHPTDTNAELFLEIP